jgi:diguanylate cyclase (GGDEF)-like protein
MQSATAISSSLNTYRGLLLERLANAQRRAARRDDGFTLAIVDIDDLGAVNDSYGSAAGAAILRELGSRMKERLRDGDTVARLDGDEFALVLDGAADEGAGSKALEKVLAALASPVYVEGERVRIELSIGACVYPMDSADEGELLRCAEFALASAKAAGGNRYRFFKHAAESGPLAKDY